MVQFNPENANVAPLRQIVSFWTEEAVYRVSSKCTTSKDLFLLSVSLTSKQRVKGRADRSRMKTVLLPKIGDLCYGCKGLYCPFKEFDLSDGNTSLS